MPLRRGMAPTRYATLVPWNARLTSSKISTPARVGNAQSSSSMAVPSAALTAWGISSRFSLTGTSGPNSWPEAMRNRRA